MFNESLSNVAMSRTDGKTEKSSGLAMYDDTRMTTIAKVILNDSDMSSTIGGTGMIMRPRMIMIPAARRRSLFFCRFSSITYPFIPFPFIRYTCANIAATAL